MNSEILGSEVVPSDVLKYSIALLTSVPLCLQGLAKLQGEQQMQLLAMHLGVPWPMVRFGGVVEIASGLILLVGAVVYRPLLGVALMVLFAYAVVYVSLHYWAGDRIATSRRLLMTVFAAWLITLL